MGFNKLIIARVGFEPTTSGLLINRAYSKARAGKLDLNQRLLGYGPSEDSNLYVGLIP